MTASQTTMSRQPTHHGYAVNVKDNSRYDYDDVLSDTEAQQVYDDVAAMFWDDADALAVEHGFQGVWSEGRMGGWCVPYPQPHTDDMYESEVERWERDTFRPFEAAILELMADYIAEAREALAEAAKRAATEPGERAYWAARDVETVA